MIQTAEMHDTKDVVSLDWSKRYEIACANIAQLKLAAETEYVRRSEVATFISRQLGFVHTQAQDIEQQWLNELILVQHGLGGGNDT